MPKRQSPRPESPFERLLPAITFYTDTESLGTAIFRCAATPRRTEQDIRKMQREFPGSSEALALSALHLACTQDGLVDNVPDSESLRLALGTDAAYLSAHQKAVRARRDEQHLHLTERSMRAAVFLREVAKRKGFLAPPIFLPSEMPPQPASEAPALAIPHQPGPSNAVDAVA